MITVTVETDAQQYPIFIGSDVLSLSEQIKSYISSDQVLIVSNQPISDLHLNKLLSSLREFKVITHFIPDGEKYKSLETFTGVIETLLKNNFRRNATIIAFGGGVVGDLAGFVASCYQRGIPFIQVPTTLLAMVDSSVGGKTAVNHKYAKNMIGAFYQPEVVFVDINLLATLSDEQFSAGMAEVIKYGLIYDFSLFEFIEDNAESILNKEPEALKFLISQCCQIKAKVVSQDEKETGIRAILNLGHTFGHALEKLGDYHTYLHGEAVAIGMLMAFELSVRLKKIERNYLQRVSNILRQFHLPTSVEKNWQSENIFNLMLLDKKNTSEKITLIIPNDFGKVEICASVDKNDIIYAIECFLSRSEE
ncbi:MAG: 3-dehydroquinate synthase [Gammaproteobacteria bacterium]|nr:3-dehydroquinate synthase [Gammaproteobacteria bacterium]